MRRLHLAFLVMVSTSVSAAENTETFVERSQAQARAVLDRAVSAMGGEEALRAVKAVRLRLSGQNWTRLQMPTASAPFEPGGQDETLMLDLENNVMVRDQKTSGAGFAGNNTIVIQAGSGTAYDHRVRTATPIPASQASQQQFTQYYRRLPNLILLQALNNTNSLRYLGRDNFDGRPHEIITFVMADTQQVALYVDAKSSLISKYELIFVDALEGDEASEILFGGYAPVGTIQVPRTFTQRLAGEDAARLKIEAEFNPPAADRVARISADGYTQVDAPPDTLKANIEKLADGVYAIQHTAGQNQHALAVEFRDHVAVVEAPGTSGGSEAVITKIKELIPGKPVRYLAITHHHGDHIGGVRTYVAEGATILTTKGNVEVVRAMASSKQNDRLGKSPKTVEISLIEGGKRVLTDGRRTLELIDVGPNPHAKEMVIAYLPGEKIIFQGDLFILPNNGPLGPPQATTAAFARKLAQLNLDVERIAGVHGPTATIEQFRSNTAGVQ
jgi:glyoxylase-like metal-dependent hydrolase (beta-lactamase superfamily II)